MKTDVRESLHLDEQLLDALMPLADTHDGGMCTLLYLAESRRKRFAEARAGEDYDGEYGSTAA